MNIWFGVDIQKGVCEGWIECSWNHEKHMTFFHTIFILQNFIQWYHIYVCSKLIHIFHGLKIACEYNVKYLIILLDMIHVVGNGFACTLDYAIWQLPSIMWPWPSMSWNEPNDQYQGVERWFITLYRPTRSPCLVCGLVGSRIGLSFAHFIVHAIVCWVIVESFHMCCLLVHRFPNNTELGMCIWR